MVFNRLREEAVGHLTFGEVSLALGVSVLATGLECALVLPPGHVAPVGFVVFKEDFVKF